MNPQKSPPPGDATEEVSALIETLLETDQRLEELTAGEVDTVADREGRTFLLRRAQDRLRHSKAAKQAAILNALPAHIALLDSQGVIISVNEAWRRFAITNVVQGPGYAVGLNYLEICDNGPRDGSSEAHRVSEGIRSVLSGGIKGFSIEYPCHTTTQQRWFQLTVTPLADDAPNGAVVMHLDITGQRRAKEELRESERRFSDMLGNVELLSLMLDHEARITYCNDYLLRLTGWRREEVVGRGWFELFIPPGRDDTRQAFLALLADLPSASHHEDEILTRSGERRIVRWNNSILRSVSGKVIGTASIGEDVTERKRAETALSESEAKYRQLTEQSADGIFVCDTQGNLVLGNSRGCELLGYTEDELLGINGNLTYTEDERELHAKRMHDVAAGKTLRYERMVRRKDGSTFPAEISQKMLDNGMVQILTRDITDRRSQEQKISRMSRIHAVSSGINAAIVRIRDRRELFQEACRIIVEHGRFTLGWIAVLDHATGKLMAVAQAGLPENLSAGGSFLNGSVGLVPGGTAKVALREKRLAVNNDIAEAPEPMEAQHEPDTLMVRRAAIALGAKSVIVLPLALDRETFGVLTLYAPERDFFDDGEIALLNELAEDISFGLEFIAKEERVERGEEELVRFGAAMDATADAIYLVDRTSMCFVHVNDAACRMQNQTREELIALGPEAALSTSRAELELTYDAIIASGMGAKPNPLEMPRRREDGSQGWVELRRHAQRSGDRWMIVTSVRDVTERKEAEHRIKHLNRVYAMLSGINALIVRVRDRDELFREACRLAVEEGGFRMSLIGTVDRSGRIVPVASAGKDEALMTAIKGILSSSEGAPTTMVARAIREKTAVVSNDSQTDPKVVFGKEYAKSGVRSMAILPLIVADEAVGVLALYAGESEFFHAEEMKLLTDLAGDIAFAIDHIETGEKLNYLAYYDALTGLANRSLFLERVAQYMRSAVSGGHKLALFLIDLERFKNINDSLGQPAGDALLRQVAQWLTRNLGDANLLSRVGADHFGVVLPKIKMENNVARLLENTIKAFMEHPFRLNDAVFRIAVKVGVALFPDDGADADALFKNAEAALKKAKAIGDRFLFYTQKLTETVAGKLTLENQLRQALDNEEFVLHYQPKVNLASGKVTSAEALIRWNDPSTGLVPPGRFIPILEETGLIHEVGRWALRKAIEEYLRWRTAGLAAVRIAVNVSPLQLRSRAFIAEIEAAIGIDPYAAAGLELEITESLIMEDVKHSIASLQAIRAMSVTIAIDDFGTGFSSLSYLSKLPVDTLKIDRSFIIDMTAAQEGLALVSTIVNLAHSLKLKVVAEGVETEEQSRLLRLLNCDEMQGFLFSKPVPSEIFEARFLVPLSAG